MLLVAVLAVAGSIGLFGCATPGQPHMYALGAPPDDGQVLDLAAADGALLGRVPSFVAVVGGAEAFAYDPFTDHFYIRRAQSNRFLVVDRPARAIKRSFEVAGWPAGRADLTVDPARQNLWLAEPDAPVLWETRRDGRLLRRLTLPGLSAPVTGLAYDVRGERLLIAGAVGLEWRARADGRVLATFAPPQAIQPGILAYDAARGEIFAVAAEEGGAGLQTVVVFDATGVFLRRWALPLDGPRIEGLDVGDRALLRLF
jgi:hypothetical protein